MPIHAIHGDQKIIDLQSFAKKKNNKKYNSLVLRAYDDLEHSDKRDFLEKKYGRLPSILSIRAHYIDEREAKLSLLKEAYLTACENSDIKNKIHICNDIAELYIEEFNDIFRAKYWINTLKDNLDHYPENEDKDEDFQDYFKLLYKILPNEGPIGSR